MKKAIPILCVSIVLVGLSVVLYPFVSDYFHSKGQSQAVASYLGEVAGMDDGKVGLLDMAHEYNEALMYNNDRFTFTQRETEQYRELLNTGRGVMGVLTIEKIGVNLPIYHGTDEGILQIGVGHIQGSSLPVGGPGTHSLLIGHRGLPSSTLLSDLNKMAEGDIFTLRVLDETLAYMVDSIQVVEPHDVRPLNIDPGMDYCTLVTCTPYGVNSHRLLVRGHRTENVGSRPGGTDSLGTKPLDIVAVIWIFVVLISPTSIVYDLIKRKKQAKGAKGND